MSRDGEIIRQCPYHVAMFISTLAKYVYPESKDNFLNFYDSEKPKSFTFKYFFVYHELKVAFYDLRTETRWEHISSWEVMINQAITILLTKMKHEALFFLDEALIENNPLAALVPLKKFSGNSELIEYNFEESFPIISVTEEYEKVVKAAVLDELSRIASSSNEKGKFSRAEMIDLLVLIRQHYSSLFYFQSIKQYENMNKSMLLAAEFPEFAFEAYLAVASMGDCREIFETIWKTLKEKIIRADPFGFASHSQNIMSSDDEELIGLMNELIKRNKVYLRTGFKERSFLRLLLSAYSSKSLRNISDLGCKTYPARFNILFDYGVWKSADREFNNLIFSLTGREAFEVLNELEGAILSSVCHHSIYDFNLCIYFGLKDTLEMLLERFPFRTVDLIEISIRYGQSEIAKMLLIRYGAVLLLQSVLKIARIGAQSASLEVIELIFSLLPAVQQHGYLLSDSKVMVKEKNFAAFEFTIKHLPLFTLFLCSNGVRNDFIKRAMELCLPENRILKYFLMISVVEADNIRTVDVLTAAVVNGYLGLIEEFKLYEQSDYSLVVAVGKAAGEEPRQLTPTMRFCIDRLTGHWALLVHQLVLHKARQALHYTVTKMLQGSEISPIIRFDLIVYLVFGMQAEEVNYFQIIPEFCEMMNWTRSQIEPTNILSSKFKSHFVESYRFKASHMKIVECCMDLIAQC